MQPLLFVVAEQSGGHWYSLNSSLVVGAEHSGVGSPHSVTVGSKRGHSPDLTQFEAVEAAEAARSEHVVAVTGTAGAEAGTLLAGQEKAENELIGLP